MPFDCRPFKPVVAALIVHLAFLSIYLVKHRGDPSSLLCAGSDRAGAYPYEAVSCPIGPSGHDGQFYYALARRPFAIHTVGIDCAPARQLRILYPALCWIGSGGGARLLFYVMPAVNLAIVTALAWLGALFALRHGRSGWWGFLLPIALNLGVPLVHNFTDCLSTLAVFGLVASWFTGSPWWAVTLWAGTAVFGREQNAAVIGIVAAGAWWHRRFDVLGGLAVVGALWLAWVCVLWHSYGSSPFLPTQGNFAVPGSGMAYLWGHLGGDTGFSRRRAILNTVSLLHQTVLIPVALYVLTSRRSGVLTLLLVAGLALTFLAGKEIYEFWNYPRVLVWLPLGIWFGGILSDSRWLGWSLAPAVMRPVIAALGYI